MINSKLDKLYMLLCHAENEKEINPIFLSEMREILEGK